MSTSLDEPYQQDILFSLFPGGSYSVGNTTDTAIQTSLSLQDHIPLLTVSELTTRKQISRVLYPMIGATLQSCQLSTTDLCDTKKTRPTIQLNLPTTTSLKATIANNALNLNSDTITLLSVDMSGSIYMTPDITLVPIDTSTI